MAKTNKAVLRRVRVTKNGKVLKRRPHQNHFSAKKSRSRQMANKKTKEFAFGKIIKNRYLPNT
ncbi:MAG: 50S ribosomal protein L35 [Candidatus Ryanbacteria bacterium]|nr:50S ribosomal protein L35 [Candidatus Ryanbacteria bacterium]